MKVITVKGDEQNIKHCLKYKNDYYLKERDAFKVGNRYYPVENLYYDSELKKYKTSSYGLKYGVIDIKDNKFVYGYFSKNVYNNAVLSDGSIIMNPSILSKDWVYYNYVYYNLQNIPIEVREKLSKKYIEVDHSDRNYNTDNSLLELYEGYNLYVDRKYKRAGKLIPYTYGFEIETINGTLPQHICNRHGLDICKDGSTKRNGIYPPEYVTCPMSGGKGLKNIELILKEISNVSQIDKSCSLHLHLGGFEKTRLFLISLYRLSYKIQDELFTMFPLYRENEMLYAKKEKNYCKKLPLLLSSYRSGDFNEYVNLEYENMYSFLSGCSEFTSKNNFKNKRHVWGNHKWNFKPRYHWINFVNLTIGNIPTIEFRLHTPTLNKDKAINWLLICNAILLFANNNIFNCISNKKITVKDVLDVYKNIYNTNYSEIISENLYSYFLERKNAYSTHAINVDVLGNTEAKKDLTYSFDVLEVS